MDNKKYFKIAWTLLPEGSKTAMIIFPVLSYLMVICSYFAENGGITGISFMFLGYALTYLIMSAPLHGASPSEKGSMKENAQSRELRSGSSGIYDSLCVLPITRRQTAACYMSIYRIIVGIYSLLIFISLFITPSSEKSCFVRSCFVIIIFGVISAINLYFASNSSSCRKLSVIIMIILAGAGAAPVLLGIFHIIELSPEGVRNTAVIIVLASNLLTELIMRATALNPKKHYARNGELNL